MWRYFITAEEKNSIICYQIDFSDLSIWFLQKLDAIS